MLCEFEFIYDIPLTHTLHHIFDVIARWILRRNKLIFVARHIDLTNARITTGFYIDYSHHIKTRC